MKRIFLSALLLCSLLPSGASKAWGIHEGNESRDDKGVETELADYFKRAVADASSAAAFNPGRTQIPGDAPAEKLKAKDVAQWQGRVWELWTKAVAEAGGETLAKPVRLEQTDTSMWHIPSELEASATMPYYFGSTGLMPKGGWPLLLYLHGSGPKEREWATGRKLCQKFDGGDALYFIPQIPNEGQLYRWWHRSKQFAWERLLRQALASGRVNADSVYFFGISEGGYGSQRLAAFYADYLAAAGPMAGGEPPVNAPAENMANTPFSLRTGERDEMFCRARITANTAAEYDSLAKLHPGLYEHFIELEPGSGHGINYYPTIPWMRQYGRNAQPRYVCWEDFAMDGRRRAGFANMQILSSPADEGEGRLRYEMRASGDSVVLTVDSIGYTPVEFAPSWGNFPIRWHKSFTPATGGRLRLFLSDSIVDPSRRITVTVNGAVKFRGKLRADVKAMAESAALFGDPCRVFPYAVELNF